MVRAGIELSKENTDAAFALYQEELAQGPVKVDASVRWANFFRLRSGLDVGLKLLDQSIAAARGDDKNTLDIERVTLCSQERAFSRASEILAELEKREDLRTNARDALIQAKLSLVRRLIAPGEGRDPKEADRLSLELEAESPNDPEMEVLRSRVFLAFDPPDVQGARNLVQPALDRDPGNVAALVAMAEIAEMEDNISLSLDYATKAANAAPTNPDAAVLQGEMLLRLRRPVEGVAALEQALRNHPEDLRVKRLLIEGYRVLGRVSQAETLLNQLTAAVGDAPETEQELLLMRARLELSKGENLPAVETRLREHLEKNPDDIRTLTDLATTLARQERLQEAEKLMKDYAELHADEAGPWVALGQFYMAIPNAPDLNKAQSALTHAIVIDRNDESALLRLIELHLRQARLTEALGLCDRYLARKPDDVTVLFQKARILSTSNGRDDEAIETISRAIQIAPQAEQYYVRGVLLNRKGRYKDAQADLQEALKLSGTSSAASDVAIAEAYFGDGQIELATTFLDSALRKASSGDPLLRDELNRVTKLIKPEGTSP